MREQNSVNSYLPLSHALLALAVVAVWGTNFVVIKLSLNGFPPFLFAALRFTFALFPAIFFCKRPNVAWSNLAIYGIFIGVGQFGIMFFAINHWISPGLASLVSQTQVFFTIGLSMFFARERIRLYQVGALTICVIGLVVIAMHTDATTTFLGLALVVFSGFSWAAGNTVSRAAGSINMLSYVVWASAFAIPPLFMLSFLFEGGDHIPAILLSAPLSSWIGVFWQAWPNTLFGYVAWAWLLSRHPAATIVPAALLVPVFGMGASAFFLGESLPSWKLLAAGLVIAGLILNTFWPSFKKRLLNA